MSSTHGACAKELGCVEERKGFERRDARGMHSGGYTGFATLPASVLRLRGVSGPY